MLLPRPLVFNPAAIFVAAVAVADVAVAAAMLSPSTHTEIAPLFSL